MSCCYPDVRTVTPAELSRLNFSSWLSNRSSHNFTLSAEVLCAEGDATSRYPCQQSTSIVKPFFDYDERVGERPEASVLRERYDSLHSDVLAMLKAHPGGEHLTDSDIYVAQRHGHLYSANPDDAPEFKISYRFYISGVRTTLSDITAIITKAGHHKRFDISVYSKGGKMCCIFSIKGSSDKRVLLPMEDPEDQAFDSLRYIIQHTESDWPMLQPVARPAARIRRAPEPAALAPYFAAREARANRQAAPGANPQAAPLADP